MPIKLGERYFFWRGGQASKQRRMKGEELADAN